MFSKSQRMSRPVFAQYFTGGTRIHSPAFTLVFSPETPLLVSVVVGKKVYKGAVDRNRLRRRIYASMYRYFIEQEVGSGAYIIITKPAATKLSRLEIITEIKALLARTPNPR